MEDFAPFDWDLYGMILRKKRTDLGFKKAEDFTEGIWRRTRVRISRDTLYKIEQGRQIPDATQFMALNIATCFDPFDANTTNLCMSQEWKEVVSRNMPDGWREQNSEKIWKTVTGMNSAEDASCTLPDPKLLALLDKNSQNLAKDNACLFDPNTDSRWREGIESHFTETYGLDHEFWPEPDFD